MRGTVAFAVASPVWLLLLLVLPAIGMAPMVSLVLATIVTGVLAWIGLRWFTPPSRRPARPPDRPPGPFDGTRRWLIGAGVLIALGYLILVLRAGA